MVGIFHFLTNLHIFKQNNPIFNVLELGSLDILFSALALLLVSKTSTLKIVSGLLKMVVDLLKVVVECNAILKLGSLGALNSAKAVLLLMLVY